jgi:hypothetical protein
MDRPNSIIISRLNDLEHEISATQVLLNIWANTLPPRLMAEFERRLSNMDHMRAELADLLRKR